MKEKRSGFTLIEIIITLGIFLVLGGIVFTNLTGRRSEADLNSADEEIAATLRQAQSASMQEKSGLAWGVHFDNSTTVQPFYTLFSTSLTNQTYTATSVVGGNIPLPTSVSYVTSSIASGATLNIIFQPGSGATTSTNIGLYMPIQGFSSTISISSIGTISY